MEFFKRTWVQAGAYLHEMPATSKWLIGMIAVVLVLVALLFMLYVHSSPMVPITPFIGGPPAEAIDALNRRGVQAQMRGNQIVVPRQQHDKAISILVEGDLLHDNASRAFDEMVVNGMSIWETRAQGDRRYLLAKQEALARIIRRMNGVRSAEVVISMPQDMGLGVNFTRPTASVTIGMQGTREVNQDMVHAVAGLVASGAAAEMTPQDVVVIDANRGRQHTVKDERDALPTEVIQLVRQIEDDQYSKITNILRYIDNVIVAVNAHVDSTRHETVERQAFQENEPLVESMRETITRTTTTDAGEPGARPNVGLDIEGGRGAGTQEEISRNEERFGQQNLIERRLATRSGHAIQRVAVTINVPRSYFVNLHRLNNPDEQDMPDDAALQPLITQEIAKIERQVKNLVEFEQEGNIAVAMYYDNLALQPAAAGVSGGSLVTMVESGWFTPALLVGLALMVIGISLWMVRNATRPEAMPSVEELAGVPPTLPTEDDLVGEVDAFEATMAGVELDENEIKSRRIAEQISDLIKANPHEAGNILGRWVQPNE